MINLNSLSCWNHAFSFVKFDSLVADLNMITVHKDTDKPTKTWEKLKVKQNQQQIEALPLDYPIDPKKLR